MLSLKVNKNKVIFLYHALIRIAVSQFNFGSKFLSKIEKTYFSFILTIIIMKIKSTSLIRKRFRSALRSFLEFWKYSIVFSIKLNTI